MAGLASRILVIGCTGYLGRRLVRASISMGHPTYVLLRPKTLPDPSKQGLIDEFESIGVTILQGDLNDHDNLIRCIKLVDVIISALSADLHHEQHKIIRAIKEAGNIKRFLPSEFGFNVDRVTVLPPCKFVMDIKVKIRRVIEEAGIPHTYVAANFMAEYFIDLFLHPHEQAEDEVIVYGTGKVKGENALNEPENIGIALVHRMFVDKRPSYELGENELEASELYPDYRYTPIDLVMDKVISDPPKIKYTSFPNSSGGHSASVTNGKKMPDADTGM
ncbi:Eugenol synthase 1 [Acorus calamus]|uniref:Eugenol synthase 1 n=1 Tax=Acorus calamus TaxID=4465 RepID=A0AAV9FKY8_ACOCL|nr:Eugenol synthase 1 [Acorus calamus]